MPCMADPCLIAELLHRDHSVSSQRLKPARLQRATTKGLPAEASRRLTGAGCGVVFLTSSGRSNFSGTSQVSTVLCVSALSTVVSSLRDRFPALISVESAARSYPATAAQHNARSFAISDGKAGRDWPCGEVESSGNVPANSSQRASRADYLPGSSPAWPTILCITVNQPHGAGMYLTR